MVLIFAFEGLGGLYLNLVLSRLKAGRKSRMAESRVRLVNTKDW